ncbi:MAG: phage tail tube protein [Desulfuromonadales bacterium]|nr:phage tail tube protein [Desulfuromonadales bacterium]
MSQAKGTRSVTLIQEETTFNVDPATPDAQKLYISSNAIKLSRGQEESDILRGDRNPTKAARGDDDVSGSLGTELQAYMGILFKAALGSVATTGAGPYIHTFTIGQSLPSFMIEKGFADVGHYFKYNGCKASRFNMDVTRKGFQKISVDFMGAKETVGSSSFDDTPTDLGKVSFDGLTVSTLEEGGATIADVLSIDGLTFDNDLDGDQYCIGGGGVRADIPEGLLKVSGTLKARFKDLALYNKAISDTESSLRIVWSLGSGDGSAGNESIELKLPELSYGVSSPVVSGPKGLMVELPFTGYYSDAAEASSVQVILKNTQDAI